MKVQQITTNKNKSAFGISSPFSRVRKSIIIKPEVIALQTYVEDLNKHKGTKIEICRDMVAILNRRTVDITNFRKIIKIVADTASKFSDKDNVSIFLNGCYSGKMDSFYIDLFKRSPKKICGEVQGDSNFWLELGNAPEKEKIKELMAKSHESVDNQVKRNLLESENRKKPESYSQIMNRLLFDRED